MPNFTLWIFMFSLNSEQCTLGDFRITIMQQFSTH